MGFTNKQYPWNASHLRFRKMSLIRWTADSGHTCAPQTWVCVANGNEINLPQLVSEGLIVLWLRYYLQSSRYLASLNSFKWCVDSENKPGEQRPGGIQGSYSTASSPPFGSGYNGLKGKMDGQTKSLEFCQCASAPEVWLTCPLECHLSQSGFTLGGGAVWLWFEMSVVYDIYLKKKTVLCRWQWSENVIKWMWIADLRSGGVHVMSAFGGEIWWKIVVV